MLPQNKWILILLHSNTLSEKLFPVPVVYFFPYFFYFFIPVHAAVMSQQQIPPSGALEDSSPKLLKFSLG